MCQWLDWQGDDTMTQKGILIALALVLLTMAFIALNVNVAPASAKPADTYTIEWYTIDGGGVMNASGGSYTLSGTIGQYDAGTQSGGSYKITGGFWGFLDSLRSLFLPLITR